ncbi:ester cyclase [Rhodococcus sp. NPDC127530]|uniref:ester cyclase n=1 Tax=unclassified Rhodococcus (in: high G+C Gram-positive bacteria) TaxID=192944 RepID=UPI00363F0823
MALLTQLVTDLYTAYNNHRPADAAKLYAPLCRHRDIAVGADHRTPERIAAGLVGLFAAFPDVQWNLDEILINENRAAVTYRLSGHLNGRLGSYEPKGQSLYLAGVQLLEVRGNHIISSTDYWDGGALHRQLSKS